MMEFKKVSQKQFLLDCPRPGAIQCYNGIILPYRATQGSAGYDFFAPFDFELPPGQAMVIPTGIRWVVEEYPLLQLVLQFYPRSGSGFRYKTQLYNTVGIIDQDYFAADNEGHILLKLAVDNKQNKTWRVKQGEAFAQGIIYNFVTTDSDRTKGQRRGGFGSTSQSGNVQTGIVSHKYH